MTIRKNITQPADHWAAFSRAAKAAGMSLSQWLGECAIANLEKDAAKKLSERKGAHRPTKVSS